MGSPTLFANPFSVCSNYLLSPKPGEKRSLFNTKILNRTREQTKSVPLVIDLFSDFPDKLLETNMGSYLTKYNGKLPFSLVKCNAKTPFQAPMAPIKMPSLIGGYVGAKSQSLREESAKLCDILASLNLPDSKVLTSKFEDMHNFVNKSNCKENTAPEIYKCVSKTEIPAAKSVVLTQKPHADKAQPISDVDMTNTIPENSDTMQTKNSINTMCDNSQEDKGKPPMKKPKLNLKTCRSSRRKHKGRRKKCVKNIQCDSPGVSPGYDPTQSTFESIDETDCCIKLSNRFAPLEDITTFHVWSETPRDLDGSDAPILNMLSEMHLDDFEVDLESASPTMEIFNMHSYESADSPLTCNSTIAFILGGNDDVMTSDSEDSGSFASDLDWQSFKTDFEFFQDQLPLQDLIAESCSLNSVHIENCLELVDDDVFLNDLEYHPTCDAEQTLREINLRWNQSMGNDSDEQRATKVCFAPDNCLTSVHYIPSGPEECQARKGPWDQCYLDRCRFEKRIQEVEPIISLCLTPQHRKTVFQRLFGGSQN